MDHSMHQAGMDHGHGDMDMGDQCSMNMHFTFSSHNLCIIFKQWRITGPLSLLFSLVAIALLTAGYEGVRALARRYEARHALALKDGTIPPAGGYTFARTDRRRRGKLVLGALYAVQVFYSFMIMLLFMTYNGWIMLAVAVGAFLGYITFGGEATKPASCH
ncbi:low-affinity Cu transporter [Blastomyces dermatitidis ER-3]|uniref:Copper transport protein n=3 Tax=Blastomyces TaxID=229219 RepID=A0A179UG73_BLAGS|nr:hypothetical protein, variant [Blastomyces gilchristii SLH14081]XP_045280558.1 low-affinity Cu transporter [Blastomyces dermatitidis ER-3]EQL38639.1 hypothetical protein, variant [Blastomyces dermatitidis ATCC 26199]KMW66446.1 ctr copper transporter, variant [Blastomyces dermatitidis ATCC 18188]OAT00831.1 hypothetical protein, variant [Blastomyces dermatitidis ER-3]OAT05502.1 hypothetical protein, variant [Blastomyces gilchristii SLH14081]